MKNKQVFISYSWDSEEHKQWCIKLNNTLRSIYGIDSEIDVMSNESNFNKMMVSGIKDRKMIMICTENYVEKADSFVDGVGFEVELSLPKLKENRNNIIPILRSGDSVPFCVKGIGYLNFKNGMNEENLDELVLRIEDKSKYEKVELNTTNPKQVNQIKIGDFEDDLIPNLKRYTEKDFNDFIIREFFIFRDGLQNLLEKTKNKNDNFDYEINNNPILQNNLTTIYMPNKEQKNICFTLKIFLEGQTKKSMYFWIACQHDGRLSIFGSFDCIHALGCGGSYNMLIEAIEIDKKFELKKIMGLDFLNNTAITSGGQLSKDCFNYFMRDLEC